MSAAAQLVGVHKSFPGVVALDGVDLALEPGRIHALVGENGAGKSTLIHVLSGNLTPDRGELLLGGRPARFANAHAARRGGVVPVHQELDLFPDLSAAENFALRRGLPVTRLGLLDRPGLVANCRTALAAIGEELPLGAPASDLSPAQRQLVEIAAAVSQQA